MFDPNEFNENNVTPMFGDQIDRQYEETEAPRQTIAEATAQQAQQQAESDAQQPVYAVPVERRKTRKEKKPMMGGLGKKVVALALCCSLVGGALGAGGMALLSGSGNKGAGHSGAATTVLEGQREINAVNVAKIDTSKEMTPSEVYAANVNSTVGITTSITSTNFWGYQTTAAASGSGFIISEDGYILTNFHVIEDANSVTVTMFDDTTYEAELVGYDESNDIAVLKAKDASGLTPVVMGDSDHLMVGESVLAIGNPLGELTFSLTAGAVSALDRKVTMSNGLSMELIQTDCAINSGNSGGALFNLYGEVIGITNAKYSSSGNGTASIDNIGFAIPINTVRGIVQSIIENGYVSKPYIGVSVENVSTDAQSYGLPMGAVVRKVEENGPAAKAGLQANDIITAVNGTDITSSDDLIKQVSKAQPGDQLTFTIYRQNTTSELTVTVEEKIQSAIGQEEESAQNQQAEQPTEEESPWPHSEQGQQNQQGQQMNPFSGMDPFSFFFGY